MGSKIDKTPPNPQRNVLSSANGKLGNQLMKTSEEASGIADSMHVRCSRSDTVRNLCSLTTFLKERAIVFGGGAPTLKNQRCKFIPNSWKGMRMILKASESVTWKINERMELSKPKASAKAAASASVQANLFSVKRPWVSEKMSGAVHTNYKVGIAQCSRTYDTRLSSSCMRIVSAS